MTVVDRLRAEVVVAVIRAPSFEAALAGSAALVRGAELITGASADAADEVALRRAFTVDAARRKAALRRPDGGT